MIKIYFGTTDCFISSLYASIAFWISSLPLPIKSVSSEIFVLASFVASLVVADRYVYIE